MAKGPAPGAVAVGHIRNKHVRSREYLKLRQRSKINKIAARNQRQKDVARAQELGQAFTAKLTKTFENTRESSETVVAAGDEEAAAVCAEDEFAARTRQPLVLLTTCCRPSALMYQFLSELLEVLPLAQYYRRKGFPLKKIIHYATARGFSDILVVNETRKKVDGLLLIHLPLGPTAHFKLSSLVLGKDIKGHGRATSHKPELLLNNFVTQIGHRVGRMFSSLFSQSPTCKGRRVVTFHNQRDHIFFRHHRYVFEHTEPKKKSSHSSARLQELGPRFTLKLLSLQKGTFDSKQGEFEWARAADASTHRRCLLL